MKNYSELNDEQINLLVAKELGVQLSHHCQIKRLDDHKLLLEDNTTHFDPCNSWADAGPIILENKIDITFEGREPWQHKCIAISPKVIGGVRKACLHKNPLRAAMTVFLAMHEAKNE